VATRLSYDEHSLLVKQRGPLIAPRVKVSFKFSGWSYFCACKHHGGTSAHYAYREERLPPYSRS